MSGSTRWLISQVRDEIAALRELVAKGRAKDTATYDRLDGPPSQRVAHSVLLKLTRGVESVVFGCASDSSGDNSGYLTDNTVPLRWGFQLMQALAAAYPAYTVGWVDWLDDAASSTAAAAAPYSWATPTIIQAGPSGLVTRTVTGSTASNVITDTSAASGDAGMRVVGLNVPPHAYVGTVSAGVSWTMVNEQGAAVAPLGAVTSVKLSADPLLIMWNAAVGGSRLLYGLGSRAAAMYTQVRPDLLFVNHGHNENSPITGQTVGREQFRVNYQRGIEQLRRLCPDAAVICVGQNPRFDDAQLAADEPIRVRIVGDVAAQRGYGYVDIRSRFLANTNWQADWMTVGGLHPNTAGYAQWADEIIGQCFTIPAGRRLHPATISPSLLDSPASEQLVPSGSLVDLPPDGSLPTGWSVSNCTATIDTATYGFATVKLVGTGSGGYLQIPLDVSKVAGRTVTAVVEEQYGTGTGNFQIGAVSLHWTDPVNGAGQLASDYPSTQVNGKRAGEGAFFYQPVTATIPKTASAAHLWIKTDTLGGTEPLWVSFIGAARTRHVFGKIPARTGWDLGPGSIVDRLVSAVAAVAPGKVAGLAPYFTAIGASLPGAAGNFFSTPSAAANRITGDLEMGVKLGAGTTTRPSGQQTLIGKWGGTGKCYRLFLDTTGALNLSWTSDGSTTITKGSTATLSATLPSDLWVRVQLVASTGQPTFATSIDGASWSTFGSASAAGSTSIFDSSTQVVEVGSSFQGTASNLAGAVLDAWVKSTIGGSNAVHLAGSAITTTTWVADTSETWTASGVIPFAYGLTKSLLTAVDAATLAGAGGTPSLTNFSGAIGADVPLPAGTATTVLTTVSLPVGAWLIDVAVLVLCGVAASQTDVKLVVGTATATLSGIVATTVRPAAANQPGQAVLKAMVTVTGAGTLAVSAIAGSAATAKYQNVAGITGATGYTAVKVA